MPEQKNQLYYGDNLDVLRRYLPDQSVDLIYLDPPFNSRQDYNVLFAEKDGSQSSSQIRAFEDTWEWNTDAEHAYIEIVERGGEIADVMRAFRIFLKSSDMMAYLAMMAPRLAELAVEPPPFLNFLKAGFQQKCKTLANNLRACASPSHRQIPHRRQSPQPPAPKPSPSHHGQPLSPPHPARRCEFGG